MATTKKSGTIAYQLRRQNDLTGTATEKNPQMAVTVVNSKLTTTKELAEYINFACSVTESDIAAVLQALGKCVCDELLDGNRVEIDHIGTFSLSLTCGRKKLEDRVTKNDIRVKNILFTPCTEMKQAMRGADIVSGKATLEDLWQYALSLEGEVRPASGKQEYLESVLNSVMFG